MVKKNQFWKVIKMLDWSKEGNDDEVLTHWFSGLISGDIGNRVYSNAIFA